MAPNDTAKATWREWLGRWLGKRPWRAGANNFSRRHTLRFRIEVAKKDWRTLDAYVQALPSEKGSKEEATQAAWKVEKQNIDEHLRTAAEELRSANGQGGALETSLRHVMAAERKLIAFFPDERGAGARADLRRDILAYVPEERRAEPLKALEKVKTALQNKTAWKDDLLEVKVEVDEILVRGYQTRERLREGIGLLGRILGVILFVLLVVIPFIFRIDLFTVANTTSAQAMWTGALFGGIGACLSGLMNFTVHRMVRGEYEPAAATGIRPLIGSTSGLLAAVLVASGILNFNGEQLSGLAIVAFLLGFSERLVMGTVERLSTRAETQGSSAP